MNWLPYDRETETPARYKRTGIFFCLNRHFRNLARFSVALHDNQT